MKKFLDWIKKVFFTASHIDGSITVNNSTKQEASNDLLKKGCFGIDISHHNTVDFQRLDPSVEFVFLKATEGETYVDPTFEERWDILKGYGVKRGAYHFFRADKDALTQAVHFCKTVGALDVSDLPLVLDMETTDGKSIKFLRAACKIFLDEVEKRTGKTPIIYSGHSFLLDMELDESFARYPLWLARYTSKTPVAPAPWKEWTFWQYSETQKVSGIGVCDCNRFKYE